MYYCNNLLKCEILLKHVMFQCSFFIKIGYQSKKI